MKTSLIAAVALVFAAVAPAAAQTTTANPLKKPAPAAAAPAASTPAPSAPAAPAASATEKKQPSEAQMAARNRMKECGAEWQAAKKAGKTEGKTWRQFSSECLKKK